jgi:hypothetical protein
MSSTWLLAAAGTGSSSTTDREAKPKRRKAAGIQAHLLLRGPALNVCTPDLHTVHDMDPMSDHHVASRMLRLGLARAAGLPYLGLLLLARPMCHKLACQAYTRSLPCTRLACTPCSCAEVETPDSMSMSFAALASGLDVWCLSVFNEFVSAWHDNGSVCLLC